MEMKHTRLKCLEMHRSKASLFRCLDRSRRRAHDSGTSRRLNHWGRAEMLCPFQSVSFVANSAVTIRSKTHACHANQSGVLHSRFRHVGDSEGQMTAIRASLLNPGNRPRSGSCHRRKGKTFGDAAFCSRPIACSERAQVGRNSQTRSPRRRR